MLSQSFPIYFSFLLYTLCVFAWYILKCSLNLTIELLFGCCFFQIEVFDPSGMAVPYAYW